MRHRLVLCLVSLLVASVAGAQTQSPPPAAKEAPTSPAAATSSSVKPKAKTGTAKSGGAKASAVKKAAVKGSTGTAAKGASGKSAAKSETRTLQDIHIEGEIPVPQVLFITARDQRRFVDFQYQRYLKTSKEVGEQTVFPSRIVVTGSQPADPTKETRP